MNKEELLEQIEQSGKRVHFLLYGDGRENYPQYTQWRDDLESTIIKWIDQSVELALKK